MVYQPKKDRKNKNSKLSNKEKEHFKHDHMDLRRIKREKRKNKSNNDEDVKAKISKSEDRDVKKDLKNLRKTMKNKSFYEASTEIKRIWEELRKIDSTRSEKGQKLAEEIFLAIKACNETEEQAEKKDQEMSDKPEEADKKEEKTNTNLTPEEEKELLTENLFSFTRKHDTSRVIQAVLNYAQQPLRIQICQALVPKFHEMMKIKYANFCADKMISCIGYKKERELFLSILVSTLLKNVGTKVGKLMRDPYAGMVLESLFSNYTNERQQTEFKCNFWGKDFIMKCERFIGGNREQHTLENLMVKLGEKGAMADDKKDDERLALLMGFSKIFENYLEKK